jgi:hypothetical protein
MHGLEEQGRKEINIRREENTDNLWHDDVKITVFVFPEIIFATFVPPGFRHHIFVSF